MNTALTSPDEDFKLSPEALEITQTYLSSLSIDETAKSLSIPREQVVNYLNKKEVKRFIDTVYIEQGYMNKFKLSALLDKVIMSKLEEAEETGVYTNKDLLEVISLAHKIQDSHIKNVKDSAPGKQTNVQVNNYGDNLGNLIERVIKGES